MDARRANQNIVAFNSYEASHSERNTVRRRRPGRVRPDRQPAAGSDTSLEGEPARCRGSFTGRSARGAKILDSPEMERLCQD